PCSGARRGCSDACGGLGPACAGARAGCSGVPAGGFAPACSGPRGAAGSGALVAAGAGTRSLGWPEVGGVVPWFLAASPGRVCASPALCSAGASVLLASVLLGCVESGRAHV